MSALEAVVAERLRSHMETFGPLTDEDQEFHGGAVDAICEGIVAMQPEHFINFDDDGGWTIQHSMRCRLEGTLLDCPYTLVMQRGSTGGRRGLFVAEMSEDGRRIGLKKA